jgi:hypothetical protein
MIIAAMVAGTRLCLDSTSHLTHPTLSATNTEHDEIVELITSSGATFSRYQADWLKALTTTTAADDAEAAANNQAGNKTSQQQQQQQQQPVVPDFLPPSSEQCPHIYMGDIRPSPTADPERVSFRGLGMDEQELWAAVGELQSIGTANTIFCVQSGVLQLIVSDYCPSWGIHHAASVLSAAFWTCYKIGQHAIWHDFIFACTLLALETCNKRCPPATY